MKEATLESWRYDKIRNYYFREVYVPNYDPKGNAITLVYKYSIGVYRNPYDDGWYSNIHGILKSSLYGKTAMSTMMLVDLHLSEVQTWFVEKPFIFPDDE